MSAKPYDVRFTITGDSAEYGFMLVTPPGQTKQLTIGEVGGPSAQRTTGEAEATHQDFSPEQDSPFSMATFTGGVGQLEFDGQDETSCWWGSGIVQHVDGRVYLAPSTSTLALGSSTTPLKKIIPYIHSDGTKYDFAITTTYIYRRNASNSTNGWTIWYGPVSYDISDLVFFDVSGVNYAIVAVPTQPDPNDFVVLSGMENATATVVAAEQHTPFTDALGKPKFFIPVRGTLIALVDKGKAFLTVAPTADAWTGPITTTISTSTGNEIDSVYKFQGGVAVNDYVFVFTYNAGYSIDSQQTVTETFWQWKNTPSINNFKYFAVGGDLLVYSNDNEVFVYDPTTGQNLRTQISRRSGFSVQDILGLDADSQFIYVLAQVRVPNIRSAASVALFRGWRTRGGKFAFEVLYENTSPSLSTTAYGPLKVVSGSAGARAYFGTYDSTATPKSSTVMMDMPYDWDASNGSVTSFTTTGTLFCSISRANFPGFSGRHLWVSYETEGGHAASPKIAVAYSTDNGVTFTSLGDTTSGASGLTRLTYSNVASRGIVLRFTLTGDGTATPVLKVFDHHKRIRFRYLQTAQAGVRIATGIKRLNGTSDNKTQAQLLTDIETLRSTDGQILYEDFLGNSWYCSVDSFGYRPTRHENPTEKGEMEALIYVYRADAGS